MMRCIAQPDGLDPRLTITGAAAQSGHQAHHPIERWRLVRDGLFVQDVGGLPLCQDPQSLPAYHAMAQFLMQNP